MSSWPTSVATPSAIFAAPSPGTSHVGVTSATASPTDTSLPPSTVALGTTTLPNKDVETRPPLVRNARSRSEALFLALTSLDARSLILQGDEEFYLFMNMRHEKQWVTYQMTSKHWVPATEAYNKRLQAICASKGITYVTGTGRLVSPTAVEVDGVRYEGRHVILATGSQPKSLPGLQIDGNRIISSDHALASFSAF